MSVSQKDSEEESHAIKFYSCVLFMVLQKQVHCCLRFFCFLSVSIWWNVSFRKSRTLCFFFTAVSSAPRKVSGSWYLTEHWWVRRIEKKWICFLAAECSWEGRKKTTKNKKLKPSGLAGMLVSCSNNKPLHSIYYESHTVLSTLFNLIITVTLCNWHYYYKI